MSARTVSAPSLISFLHISHTINMSKNPLDGPTHLWETLCGLTRDERHFLEGLIENIAAAGRHECVLTWTSVIQVRLDLCSSTGTSCSYRPQQTTTAH